MTLLGYASLLFRIRQGMERISFNACDMFLHKILTRPTIQRSQILFFGEAPRGLGSLLNSAVPFKLASGSCYYQKERPFATSQVQARFADRFCILILRSFHSSRSLSIKISQQQRWVNIDGSQSTVDFISFDNVYVRRQRCFTST